MPISGKQEGEMVWKIQENEIQIENEIFSVENDTFPGRIELIIFYKRFSRDSK
jgi:hypothetical protein